jgi:hypothetical protein
MGEMTIFVSRSIAPLDIAMGHKGNDPPDLTEHASSDATLISPTRVSQSKHVHTHKTVVHTICFHADGKSVRKDMNRARWWGAAK